jgi:hypothetical protein
MPSLQFVSVGGGVSQSDGQLHEFSLMLHLPSPQYGLAALAVFAVIQTKHAVNNNKRKKFFFGITIVSFR